MFFPKTANDPILLHPYELSEKTIHCNTKLRKDNLVWYTFQPFCINFFLYFTSFQYSLIHLFPVQPFSTPWTYQKSGRFSDVFRGYRKGALGTIRLKLIVAEHCLKYARIQVFSGQYFPVYRLNRRCWSVLVVYIVNFEQVNVSWVTWANFPLTISQYLSSVSSIYSNFFAGRGNLCVR